MEIGAFEADAKFREKLPEFTYQYQPFSEVLRQQKSSLFILGGWLLFTFFLLFNVKNKI